MPEEQQKTMNRWLVVAGGILIQLCLGAIYAWTAFTQVLRAEPYSFSQTQTQLIFAIGLATFAGVMALVAGRWQKKVGPRTVAITGGLVLGLGYLLAGFSGTSFWGILIGVGLLGGAGIGLAYVCPIAALIKWFPDKKGLITGLAVAGFGFGALIWIKLTEGFKFGPINLTPGWDGLYGMGWDANKVFLLYGVLFAVLVGIGAMVMINPPEGFTPAGWTPPGAAGGGGAVKVDFTEAEMMATPQFWGLFFTFFVGATAGLMVIGIIRPFGMYALVNAGVEQQRALLATGTAMGLFYSLFNGLGRILWGKISDILGRRISIVLMCVLQGSIMIAFFFIGNSVIGLCFAATVIGFNFGGNFALFPAATADYFGSKNVGTNYPWVFLSYGVGGIVGPLLGGVMGDNEKWMWAFIPAGVACLIAGGVAFALKPPKTLPASAESTEPAN